MGMLVEALDRWRREGLTTCPMSKVRVLADLPSAEPDRVQSLIEAADDGIRQARTKKQTFNPFGFLLWGLGESTKAPGVLFQPTLQISAKWRDLEADVIKAIRVQASIDARNHAPRENKQDGPAVRKETAS